MNYRKVADYYDRLLLKFPLFSKKDIIKIINFGWKSLYLLNSYGGDISVHDSDFFCYIGHLQKDSLKHFLYYVKKIINKLHILYRRKKIPWDNYYYFAITEEEYEKYKFPLSKKGRPKTRYTLTNKYLFKIKDECVISEPANVYVFKVKYLADIGFRSYFPVLKISDPILVEKHKPYKMKDILTSNFKYEYL